VIFILALILIIFILQGMALNNRITVNITAEQEGNTILLNHNGGDPLNNESISITLDTKQISPNSIVLLQGQDWPFSIGKTLIIPYTPSSLPQTLTMYYNTGTSRTEIFSAVIPPKTATQTPTPTLSPPTTEATPSISTPSPTPTAIVTPTSTTVPATTSSPPGPPQAAFEASPRSGPYPLTVSFTDLSTGAPGQWEWNFGDGGRSTGKDPVHTYITNGTYTISLKVSNAEGANTRIMQNYFSVGEPETTEAILDAEGPGSLLPGGFAQFRVMGSGARIKVGGKIITPQPGDTVRIILGSDGQGRISVQDPFILEWTFDGAEVEVNGQPAGMGRISDISIPAYEGFVSNLTLVLPPDSMKGRLIVEGSTTDLSTLPGGLTLRDFFPDQAGDLVVDTSLPGATYVQGRVATIAF